MMQGNRGIGKTYLLEEVSPPWQNLRPRMHHLADGLHVAGGRDCAPHTPAAANLDQEPATRPPRRKNGRYNRLYALYRSYPSDYGRKTRHRPT